jgi:hypothetical protein
MSTSVSSDMTGPASQGPAPGVLLAVVLRMVPRFGIAAVSTALSCGFTVSASLHLINDHEAG